ncbi:MAG: hypothetical protein J7J86_01050 [Bacteroidales bacterium]|nr:hypothetical protein [Bacteroidales bacterium]
MQTATNPRILLFNSYGVVFLFIHVTTGFTCGYYYSTPSEFYQITILKIT